jgi:acyl-homoserine lactone acylase PvdQ
MLFGCFKLLCLTITTTLFVVVLAAWSLYKERTEGTIYLRNAPGAVSITRETDSGIAHIHGENLLSVLYAQGYAHA